MSFHWINRFDAFLFDFDGLLVDSESLQYRAYQELCQELGYTLPWSFKQYCALAMAGANAVKEELYKLFSHLVERFPKWEVLYDRKKTIYLNLLDQGNLKLMPGVVEFLQILSTANKKRAVATHSPLPAVLKIKKKLPELDLIPLWITREDYKEPKPAPDAYLKAQEALNVKGLRVIGFEDSLRGVMALKRANVTPIMVAPKEFVPFHHNELSDVLYFESMGVMDLN